MKKYLIYTHDYIRQSAGVRALHKLAHYLNLSGCEAYVTSEKRNPEWVTPLASPELQQEIAQHGIVVYPEVESGNKLGAVQVVRLLLNVPGLIRGDKEIAPGEKAWAYSGLLRRYVDNPLNVLTVPVVDRGVFWGGLGLDSKTLYYFGREYDARNASEFVGIAHKGNTVTREWPVSWKDLALEFQTSSMFITYTAYTMLIHEARLCGCPVVVIPSGWWSRDDFERAMPGMNGLAWGFDPMEIARAKATVGAFPYDYDEMTAQFFVQLERFIDKTQRWQ